MRHRHRYPASYFRFKGDTVVRTVKRAKVVIKTLVTDHISFAEHVTALKGGMHLLASNSTLASNLTEPH